MSASTVKDSSLTDERPIALGRKGERVAKTPRRSLPPRRGDRTVGDHESLSVSEKPQRSQICEKASNPRTASRFRYSWVKTIVAFSSLTKPLCRETSNLVGKSLFI